MITPGMKKVQGWLKGKVGRGRNKAEGPGEGQHELDENLYTGITMVGKQLELGKQSLAGQIHWGKSSGRAEPWAEKWSGGGLPKIDEDPWRSKQSGNQRKKFTINTDVEPGKWYSWGMDAEQMQLEKDPSRQGDWDWVSGKGKTDFMERRGELEISLPQRKRPLRWIILQAFVWTYADREKSQLQTAFF